MKIVIATDGSDYSKAAVNSVAERPWLHFALVAPDGVPFLSAARRLVIGVYLLPLVSAENKPPAE